MKSNNMRMFLLAAIILLVVGMYQGGNSAVPKEAVSCAEGDTDCLGVEGQPCVEDADCPCWGSIEGTDVVAYGLGIAECKNGFCDTTWCYDIEPWWQWAKDTPWAWLKNNPLITLALLGLVVMFITWPKY